MKKWYDEDKKVAIEEFQCDPDIGLSMEEYEIKLKKHGLNKFEEKKRVPLIFQILKHFKDVSIIVLMIAGVLASILGVLNWNDPEANYSLFGVFIEPVVIFGIVILNIILAVSQELSAERSLEALASLNSPTCMVLREGNKQEVDTKNIVPGDIIILKTGDLVPADARLIETQSLRVEEASLTGESEPVDKDDTAVLPSDAPLGDQINMVFSGCLVVGGNAKALVVATAMDTQIGRIARYLNTTEKLKTPLQSRLDKIGRMIAFIALFCSAALFLIGSYHGMRTLELAALTVTLAVAAVPEVLNLVVTLILTHSVKKLVGKNTLIRKLQAVETLGSTSVICSDKTGTLTQNKMAIKRLWMPGNDPIIDEIKFDETQMLFLEKLLLASNVSIQKDANGETIIVGDPTETAIMRLAIDKKINKKSLEKKYPKFAEIPFSSDRKMMTVIVQKEDGKYLVLTKGAFDRIPYVKKNDQNELSAMHDLFAADALRVISLAYKEIDTLPSKDKLESVESNLQFIGFVGIIDPPRPEAKEAIAIAKKAGIRTVMITGDHAITAAAIARELKIINRNDGIITGAELAEMSDEALLENIEDLRVYARVSPDDKIRIVQAWQRIGEVVSMTGDGVNDAPALKAADVGIAMGITGTDVAKSAADMILIDDNFATIVSAITEGRNVFSNIRKLIFFLLVSNFSEVAIIIIGVSMWGASPLTPMMILLINVLGDGLPALTLAKEESDMRMMKRKPIDRNESFFSGGLMEAMVQQTVWFTIISLIAFWIGVNGYFMSSNQIATYNPNFALIGGYLRIGQSMAFITLAITTNILIFNVRSRKSIFKINHRKNPSLAINSFIVFALFVGFIVIPGPDQGYSFLGFAQLSLMQWLICIGLALLPLIYSEYRKAIDNYKYNYAERVRVQNSQVYREPENKK